MKKVILSFAAIAALSSGAKAQTTFGLEAGANMVMSSYKALGNDIPTKSLIGVKAGGIVNFELSENCSIQPGAYFVTGNGAKIGDDIAYIQTKINTIQIPINFQYSFGKPGGNRFFIGAGPYVGINVGGKVKVSGFNLGLFSLDTSSTASIGSDSTDQFKRLNVGAGVNAGYQLSNGLFARAHFDYGFMNQMPQGDENNSIKNYNVGVTVGFMFGGKHTKATKSGAKK